MKWIERLVEAGVEGCVKDGEAAVLAEMGKHPRLPAAIWLYPMGGIVGAERDFPAAAPKIVKALSKQYGVVAVSRLRAADLRVQRAVENARQLRRELESAQKEFPVGQIGDRFLAEQIKAYELGYHEVLTAFQLGVDDTPAGTLEGSGVPSASLAAAAEMVWEGVFAFPEELAWELVGQAGELQVAWTANVHAGTQFVGAVVARFDNTDPVAVSEVLEPRAGLSDLHLAVAAARQAQQATAVLQVGDHGRFYIGALSVPLTHNETVSKNPIGRTKLNWANPNVWVLTTQEGSVLRNDREGRFYSVLDLPHRPPYFSQGFPDHDPTPYLQGDYALAAELGTSEPRPEGEIPYTKGSLLAQTVLDTALHRLARAQRNQNEQLERFAVSTFADEGAKLKANTAELRNCLAAAARLAWANRSDTWTPAAAAQAERLTARIGQLNQREPLAMTYIRSASAPGEEPRDEQFVDLLAGVSDGDASLRAKSDLKGWADNADRVRAHLLSGYPGSVEHLAALYPEVALALGSAVENDGFEDLLKVLGEISGVLAGVGEAALTVVGMLLIGLVCPPSAAAVSVGFTAFAAVEGLEDLEMVLAMAAINPVGGGQLASERDVDQATFHAWIGAGLLVLDLILLRADLSKPLHYALTALSVATPFAEPILAGGEDEDENGGQPLRRLAAPVITLAAPGAVLAAAAPTVMAVKPRVPRMWITKPKLAALLRVSRQQFKALAEEMGLRQYELRALLVSLVDEPARQAVATRIYRALSALRRGGSARTVPLAHVLHPLPPPPATTAGRAGGFLLTVGEDQAGIGWAVENLAAGRRVDALVPVGSTAGDVLTGPSGAAYKGTLTDLPDGRRYRVVRETLPEGGGVPADPEQFVFDRKNRLESGGLWAMSTDSAEVVQAVKDVAPRQGVEIWSVSYPTPRAGAAATRHVVIIGAPRATATRLLVSINRPASLTQSRLSQLLSRVTAVDEAGALRRKLAGYWHNGIVEGGQVPQWLLSILNGNIGEILARPYQRAVLAKIQAIEPAAELFLDVRRINLEGRSLEFTDGVIGVLSADKSRVRVLAVFEVKTGEGAARSVQAQLFETAESRLEPDEILKLGNRQYLYNPESGKGGQVANLLSADRHVIMTKAQNPLPLREGDEISAKTVRFVLSLDGHEVTQAELEYLSRHVIEGLPAL